MFVMLAPMEIQKTWTVLQVVGGQDMLILQQDYVFSYVLMDTMLKTQQLLAGKPAWQIVMPTQVLTDVWLIAQQ